LRVNQGGAEHSGQLQIMLVRGDGMQVGADKCRFLLAIFFAEKLDLLVFLD
jgi:hypothetical protein